MRRLYLIRHGKTEANRKHLYCGATDIPLDSLGMSQLKDLHYEVYGKVHFMTSGMLRTEQTLQCLFGPVAHEKDWRFREMNFGLFEMKSYEELKDSEEYQKWISGINEENVPPSGESGIQMRKRVMEGLRDLQGCDEDSVLITHGGVIAIIMSALFPEVDKNRYEWQPEPGFGYLIENNTYKSIP